MLLSKLIAKSLDVTFLCFLGECYFFYKFGFLTINNIDMSLFKRDYNELSQEEQKEFDEAQGLVNNRIGLPKGKQEKLSERYSRDVQHHESLFPNNYVMNDHERHEDCFTILDNFLKKIEEGEREILNFIRDKEAYFLIECLFDEYNFGHQDASLFREFPLGAVYKCDFVLIGKGSGGYEFIFIELESPIGTAFTKTGSFGDIFRKGINQVELWKEYIEPHFDSLFKSEKHLPSEFNKLDTTRIHFMVIAGRRKDFEKNNKRAYRLKRESKIKILHYDNVVDACEKYLANKGIKRKES